MAVKKIPQVQTGGQLVGEILERATGFMQTQAIHVAAELGIADFLKEGPQSVDELAAVTGTQRPALSRLLRALASIGIFAEIDQGIFKQTPLGATLQRDHPLSVWPLACLLGDPSWWQSWGSLNQAILTGKPAIEHVFGGHLFDYLREHPEAARIFNAWMTRLSQITDPALVDSFDFSNLKKIVDVGGGQGSLLATILEANPSLNGVLFDLPEVVATADQRVTAIADRCEIIGGDFFDSVSAGGDAYILKQIIHDWHDDSCIKILRNCHRAMASDGRLLVIDAVIPADNAPDINKFIDLHMLVLTEGGKERTEAEFRSLLEAGGFQLTRIIGTPSLFKIIEGKPKPSKG